MPDDLRAVLEGIAYGDDERITPGDRLRAAEQLRAQDGPPPPQTFAQLVAGMSNDELTQYADAYLGERLAQELLHGGAEAERWPTLAAALRAGVEARAAALLQAQLGDVEAEVERRANERAAQLYQARAFRLAKVHDAAMSGHEAGEQGEQAPPPTEEAENAADAVSPEPPPGVLPWPARPRRRSPLHRLRGE